MPQKKKVPRLDEQSLRSIIATMKVTTENLINGYKANLQSALEEMNEVNKYLRCRVPPVVHGKIFTEFLGRTEYSLDDYEEFVGGREVVTKLMVCLMPPTLDALRLRIWMWDKTDQLLLVNNLSTLKSLEFLDIAKDFCRDWSEEINTMIINVVSMLPNVTSFHLHNNCDGCWKMSTRAMLHDKPIPKLDVLSLSSIVQSFEAMIRNLVCRIEDSLQSALEEVKQYLQCSVSPVVQDVVFTELLKITEDSLGEYQDQQSREDVLGKMMVTVMPSTIHTLRLRLGLWTEKNQVALCNKLHTLKSLKVLAFNAIDGNKNSGMIEGEVFVSIMQAICMIPKLTSFHMSYMSREIIYDDSDTDEYWMISTFAELRHLRKLDVRNLNMSSSLDLLLLEVESLEEIFLDSFELVEVLKKIEAGGRFKNPFKLKLCNNRIKSLEDFALVSKMCPCLTDLCMESQIAYEIERNPDYVTPPINMMKLTIILVKYPVPPIQPILKMLGRWITSLCLQHMKVIDFEAIITFCPNVKILELSDYEMDSKIGSSFPTFWNLESLIISGQFYISHIEPLLLCVSNIKVLQLRGRVSGYNDDEIMQGIFDHNPMTQLVEIEFPGNPSMSMKTVWTIMRNCENLKRIGRFDERFGTCIWRRQLWYDIEQLTRGNVELDVVCGNIGYCPGCEKESRSDH